MSPAASSRWCPTPEQLMILEEMYRSGIRTPNASQIQKITAHLSLYGNIQGKNVFYWFQNHKARDRQKLRRKLSKQLHFQQLQLTRPICFQSPYHHSPHINLLPYLHSPGFLPQGGSEENAPSKMMDYMWNMDIPEREMAKPVMRMYGDDCMMVTLDGGSTSPYCSSRPPLKTLQLFPITAASSNLKEEPKPSIHNITTHQPKQIPTLSLSL